VARPSLWDYAVGFYARPGVSQVCLQLQDRHRVDVNMLMLAAWAGDVLGAGLSAADVRQLQEVGAVWQREVVGPIRRLRRRMKKAAGATSGLELAGILESVKALELRAERLELEQLEALATARFAEAGHSPAARIAVENAGTVLRCDGVPARLVSEALEVFRQALERRA